MEYTWGESLNSVDLDVCVVAINRPNLLDSTLNSFTKNILSEWPNRRLIMNVDPMPNSVNKDDFIRIGMKYFESGIIRFTDKGDFSNAVKWTWSNSKADIIFNLEDDWLCFSLAKRRFIESVFQFSSCVQIRLPKRHQLKLFDNSTSGFSLNPSFIIGDWARRIAKQLESKLDPEKQIRHKLANITYYNKTIPSFDIYRSMTKLPMIYDTGAIWKRNHRLEKKTGDNYEVTWVECGDISVYNKIRYLVKLKSIFIFSPIFRLFIGCGQLALDLYRKCRY